MLNKLFYNAKLNTSGNIENGEKLKLILFLALNSDINLIIN